MLNEVNIIGRLGQDPELKKANDKAVCRMSVASSDKWTDKSGEKQESTEWFSVICWERTAENCAKYLSKGSLVFVKGKLKTRKYEKDGETKYATEVIASQVKFLEPAKAESQQSSSSDFPF